MIRHIRAACRPGWEPGFWREFAYFDALSTRHALTLPGAGSPKTPVVQAMSFTKVSITQADPVPKTTFRLPSSRQTWPSFAHSTQCGDAGR